MKEVLHSNWRLIYLFLHMEIVYMKRMLQPLIGMLCWELNQNKQMEIIIHQFKNNK